MGGFLGIKDSGSVTEISLPMNKFNIGDKIQIGIDMQNKECKKPIENYTVLLECHCRYGANYNSSYYHKTIFKKIMHPNVQKHENK